MNPPQTWETLTDKRDGHGAANVRTAGPAARLTGDCLACGRPVRWAVTYDIAHWVHVSVADILACPSRARASSR